MKNDDNAQIADAQGRQGHEPTFARFLDALHIKEGNYYKGLSVFPIFLVSKEFERSGEEFEVLGKSEDGSSIEVQEPVDLESVRLKNSGQLRAVVLDGTIISGAATSGVVGSSAILDPGESIELPVCGTKLFRADASSDTEFPLKFSLPAATHKRMIRIQSLRRMKNDEPCMKQRRVWGKLKDLFLHSEISNPSMDVEDLYNHWSVSVDDYEWRYEVKPLQVGILTFLEKEIWFIDLFLNTKLLEAAFPGLIKSYAFDAVMRRTETHMELYRERIADHDDAQETFDSLKSINYRPMKFKNSDIRNSYFFDTKNTCGTLLSNNDQLIYLVAYSKDKPPREY